MIFLTVGTQEPFDRLVAAVDDWAAAHDTPIFGQLGALKPDSYRPKHFEWRDFISADDYQRRLEASDLLVAHVGMGSIISALTFGKPLVMMARRAALGEHRNEHQLATAARFEGRAGLHIAAEAADVGPLIDRVQASGGDGAAAGLSPYAAPELIETLKSFIHAGR
ncbi:glucuronosyltransferase [Sandaracinobacter sp. RS1-74]|uniref:glycosyltransferase n=1 Tax=Sandaracinobacteroides sayramensis TaxID=2913411 RepID=UPI001EDB4F8F|nr:glucuronosyltransferase [Sandaracinobacteroides sayramensis]